MHVSPMYTKFDLGNRPAAVGGKVGRYIPAFLLSNFPRAASTDPYNTSYMHVTPDLGEFFSFSSFSFSRVHDCIHYPCKGAAVSQCQPNLASCHNVKF